MFIIVLRFNNYTGLSQRILQMGGFERFNTLHHYTAPKNAQRKGKVNTYGASQSTQANPTQNNENVSREAEKQEQQQQDQQREANDALRQGQAVSAAPQ